MKIIKGLICGIAAGIMLMAASVVGAATLTTADGVLSIETPNDNWVQTQDPTYWFVISDGSNTITIDHLSNGETLPVVTVANDTSPAVYQAFVSTKNEVFVVKGLSTSPENLQNLMQIINTIKVLKFDTKTAVLQSNAAQTNQFGIRPMNGVYYATGDGINVRNNYSTDAQKVGELNKGDQVTVTGAVTNNGNDFGWYQIQYNNGTAFVNASFLSQTVQPKTATPTPTPTPVGDPIAVFDVHGNSLGNIYEYSDGSFRNANGVKLSYEGNGVYYGEDDGYLYVSSHFNQPYAVDGGTAVYDASGNFKEYIYEYSDGSFRNGDGVKVSYERNGVYLDGDEYLYTGSHFGENQDTQNTDEVYSVSYIADVYDDSGNYVDSVYEYSDGTFRTSQGVRVSYERNGVYYNGSEYLYTSSHFNDDDTYNGESSNESGDGSSGTYDEDSVSSSNDGSNGEDNSTYDTSDDESSNENNSTYDMNDDGSSGENNSSTYDMDDEESTGEGYGTYDEDPIF